MSIPIVENPIRLFKEWFEEAKAHPAIAEPTAFTLATATADGYPSARVVLLKGADDSGFVFYTNLTSRKARELEANPRASMCFYWGPLDRQVRVRGPVERVSEAEADAYFQSRERDSQIGAWASKQSAEMSDGTELHRRVAKYALKFNIGTVPRPEFWSGFRIVPEAIEFWAKRPFRLHERLLYERDGDAWTTRRLFP